MTSNGNGPKGQPRTTVPRGNVTPPGHKNVRVYVPTSLHYRLVASSASQELSLNEFVIRALESATAPAPGSSPPGATTAGVPLRETDSEPAPGHRLADDAEGDQQFARGPSAARGQQMLAPGPRPAVGPLVVPGIADGPCAAPSPVATAVSHSPSSPDAASSGSSTTGDPARSTSVKVDEAKAERTGPR